MRYLSLFTAMMLCTISWGQQIKFQDKSFDNGFRYPAVVLADQPNIQDSLNKEILAAITDLKPMDFCIGDYGYVQKGNHLEIHLVCNCIDLAETEHRYLFFNLVDGQIVNYPDIFNHKKKDVALNIIIAKIKKTKESNPCGGNFGEINDDFDFSKMNIRLYKDGLEIRPLEGDCQSTPIHVTWTELSGVMKYNFI